MPGPEYRDQLPVYVSAESMIVGAYVHACRVWSLGWSFLRGRRRIPYLSLPLRMRVRAASVAPRRLRTASFILSSLPAIPRVAREPVAVAVCSSLNREAEREGDGQMKREGERITERQREKEKERGRARASEEFCAALRVSMAGNMGIIGGMLFETVARLVLFLLSPPRLLVRSPAHALLHSSSSPLRSPRRL